MDSVLPERGGDGHAEAHVGTRHAQVAAQGEGRATTGAGAADHRDGRFGHAFQSLTHSGCCCARTSGRRRGGERVELGDVGAGDKGAVAGTAQHQHRDAVVGVDVLAAGIQALVHRPGQRVARVRAIEGEKGDGAARS